MKGGTLTVGTQLRVGYLNKGAFQQTGGTVNVATDLILGGTTDTAGANGTYTLDGGTLAITNGLYIGYFQVGRFDFIDSDTPLSFGSGKVLYLGGTGSSTPGAAPSSDGTLNIGDGTTSPVLNTYQFEVGHLGKGVVNQQSGTVNVNGVNNLVISQFAGSNGTYNMMGGQLNLLAPPAANGDINFNSGTGLLEQTGGTITFNGGDLNLSNASTGKATVNLKGGTMNVGGNVDYRPNGDDEINVDGGSLVVTGGGNLIFRNATDRLNLTAGLLDMRGGGITFGNPNATFTFTGGTLQDVGTFGSTLHQQGGRLRPGASPGVMNVAGDYSLDPGTLEIEIQSPGLTPGTDYDVLNVSGDAYLNGTVDVVLLGGFLPDYGATFDVLQAADITFGPGFELAQPAGLPPATFFTYDVTGVAGNELLQLTFGVPEPATIWLLGSAGLWLAGLARLRRRKKPTARLG